MQRHLCCEAAIAGTGLGADSMTRMGARGGQDLNTADITGASIYCSCLTSAPLPSFGHRHTLSPLYESRHRTKPVELENSIFLLQRLDLG